MITILNRKTNEHSFSVVVNFKAQIYEISDFILAQHDCKKYLLMIRISFCSNAFPKNSMQKKQKQNLI